jgi:hypothetical protein
MNTDTQPAVAHTSTARPAMGTEGQASAARRRRHYRHRHIYVGKRRLSDVVRTMILFLVALIAILVVVFMSL